MTFYSDMAQLATDLITEFGRPMILRKYTIGGTAYSPTKTPVDSPVIGVFTSFKTSDIDGTLIKEGDKVILIDSAIEPSKADSVIDEGFVYEVVDIMDITPGDTSVMYKLHVRK
jgi:hypothetical protein